MGFAHSFLLNTGLFVEVYMAKQSVADRVWEALTPVAEELGYEIWDVEYLKEGANLVLRVYIDKPEGISIDDCEAMSRASDPVIDEMDPVDSEYSFEVSSPGIERRLRLDSHFEKCLGEKVYVKLIRPDEDGNREYTGILRSFDGQSVFVETEEDKVIDIQRKAAAQIRLCYDYTEE